MAASAAARARPSPEALPVPIIATPISDITVRTSAKSTLIKPSFIINSEMPCTAPNNTSFAALKALSMVTLLSIAASSFSFGTVIKESTYSANSVSPCCATAMRFLPSNGNGLVTTATVKIPISRATCATIGAAPVPVPPPIPAVINTISAPRNTSAMRSLSSSAA